MPQQKNTSFRNTTKSGSQGTAPGATGMLLLLLLLLLLLGEGLLLLA
jgi:hypothetical protein